ncbi:succinylglutamate desuccinylase/aspartoacylase family protein [Leptolyngbya sp. PCC 6406]|uniref:succinylglutamate desuccinylase/aspartoacylase family protein n=1 Tax=Leptolyngbya sp. PCC 6406 TaxID=1173264 RepID=UPI0002ACFC70|nr:succinylglutamate desuccinylase/aspartoacylase family protein [Leptolyngbya sp. PCC 6406]
MDQDSRFATPPTPPTPPIPLNPSNPPKRPHSAAVPPERTLTLGGVTITPGKRVKIEIPVTRLPTGTDLSLPVTVIHGHRDGPCLWLSAAIHGDELNGIEIIRRVMRLLKPSHLCGTVIAVPVVNIFGLLEQSRYLPDRRDLNRSFPGSPRGSLGARLASIFMREVVTHCTHGIDLHTGAIHRTNLPQIRANLRDPETYRFAKSFGAPIVIHTGMRDGSLRQAAAHRHIPTLLYEGGEALRFSEEAIAVGVEGIRRVLDFLGMYSVAAPTSVPLSSEAHDTRWVRASRGGFWHCRVGLGQWIARRQTLGVIADAFGDKAVEVRSPLEGWVIGHNQNPLAHQGDALVHIAIAVKRDRDDDGSQSPTLPLAPDPRL